MGKHSYESLSSASATVNNYPKKEFAKVGYFKLNAENPTAVVRFCVSTADDLEIVDVHNMKLIGSNGKTVFRDVACLRDDFSESFDKCPLCKKSVKTRTTKVYVKLIQYDIVDGKVVVSPKVWARYKSFADELVNKLKIYGDLKDCLFLVSYKSGADGKGSYSVDLQPERGIYTEENGYVKDFSAFDIFDISKHSYCIRSFDELAEMASTGKFIYKVKQKEAPAKEEYDGGEESVVEDTTLPVKEEVSENIPARRRTLSDVAEDDPSVSTRSRKYADLLEDDDELPF